MNQRSEVIDLPIFKCEYCDYRKNVPITTAIPNGIPKCPTHKREMRLDTMAMAESINELVTWMRTHETVIDAPQLIKHLATKDDKITLNVQITQTKGHWLWTKHMPLSLAIELFTYHNDEGKIVEVTKMRMATSLKRFHLENATAAIEAE